MKQPQRSTSLSALPFLIATVLGAPGVARAQSSKAAVDAQSLHPGLSPSGFPSGLSAEVFPHLVGATSVTLDYAQHPLSVSVPDLDLPAHNIVARRLDMHMAGALGLFNLFEVALDLPIVLYQGGLDTPFSRQTVGFSGLHSGVLGDAFVRGRAWLRGQAGITPALGAGLGLSLPTGSAKALAGLGHAVIAPFGVASKNFGPHELAATVAVRHHTSSLTVRDLTIQDQLAGTIGFAFVPSQTRVDRRESYVIELAGDTAIRPSSVREGGQNLEARLAFRRDPSTGAAIELGVGVGLVRGYGTPLGRIFLSFDYAREKADHDSDFDGVPDRRDACLNSPEDHDGFMDFDGCPDIDNDGDDVPDDDDECPDLPGSKSLNLVTQGCPIPTEPDADKDGVPDKTDGCPDKPEDVDRFQDDDGCPDLDNDVDRIPDLNDVCPLAAEDRNGFQDDDGCPDGGKGVRLVDIKGRHVVFYRLISFLAGQAAFDGSNTKLLDQLGSMLRQRSDLVTIRVSVYPERKGRAGSALAKERVHLIMRELAKRGVESWRLAGQEVSWDRKRASDVSIVLLFSGASGSGRRKR